MSDSSSVRQERDAIEGGRVIAIVIVSVIVGSGGVIGAQALRKATQRAIVPHSATGPAFASNTPERAAFNHGERGLGLRAEQAEALAHYGWADRDGGVAEIPIERAIDLRAGEGQ